MERRERQYSSFNIIKSPLKWPLPFLLFYLFICVVIGAFGIFAYHILKRNLINQKSKEISSIAELKIQQILDFRNERYGEAKFLHRNQTFTSTVKNFINNKHSNAERELDDWLRPIANNHFYESITIIDARSKKNIFVVSHNNSPIKARIEPGDFDCLKSDSVIFGDLTLNPTDSAIHLCIFVPLILHPNTTPEKIAIVKYEINPYKNLYGLIQLLPNKSNTGEVLVVKKTGNDVLYLNELKFKKNTALKFRLPITTKNLIAVRALLGNENVSEGVDYRGEKVLAVARLIPGTGWTLVVKFDTVEILAELKTFGLIISVAAILLLIASGFGLMVLWRQKRIMFYKSRVNDLNTIHRLSHVYKLLTETAQAIVKSTNKDELLYEVCNIIYNSGGYTLCWIGTINSSSGYIELVAHCGIKTQDLEIIKFSESQKFHTRQDVLAKTLLNGNYFVSNDIWNDPALEEWRAKVNPYQFKSLAVFPLIQNSTIVGVLYFYTAKIGFFTPDEVQLLDQLSKDLSYAMDKIDLEKNEKISKEKLLQNESLLLQQNKELVSLNEEINCMNERLTGSNERIKKINEELVVAREKAEESNTHKSTFLANMSHEIRSPMNAIIGFAGLLENSELNETQKKFCQIIINRSEDLLQIISDILDISKIDSHTVTMHIETVSLNHFLDELFLIYLNKLEQTNKKDINLVCKKPPTQVTISTDALKFRQIFTNLLENAIKFTDSGEIVFGYHSHNLDHLTFFVSDTGVGIDPKYHDKIFEIFRQAEGKAQKNYGGTGLGLAICKGNAHLLGGDVWVESEPNHGSNFYFTIKYTESEVSHRTGRRNFLTTGPTIWEGKEILLVENDPYSIQYFKNIIQKTGIKLNIAHSGKETEEYYKNLARIDLVFLDIRLPDASGLDLVKQIKAIDKEVPVIAQTAYGMEEDRKKSLEAGCDDYIAKPFKREQILNLINSFIS